MYCLIYSFQVKPGEDNRFRAAWSEVTEAYIEHAGGLGSRLHAAGSGRYIAYAQWPSKETREAAVLPEAISRGPSQVMRACCEQIETLFELTPVVDHLKPVRAIDY